MGFLGVLCKDNIQKAYLPKINIPGQIEAWPGLSKYFEALNFVVNSVIDCFNDFDNVFSFGTTTK